MIKCIQMSHSLKMHLLVGTAVPTDTLILILILIQVIGQLLTCSSFRSGLMPTLPHSPQKFLTTSMVPQHSLKEACPPVRHRYFCVNVWVCESWDETYNVIELKFSLIFLVNTFFIYY